MYIPERSVQFGTYNSITDFDLVMGDITIGSPEPQTVTVDIPFRDGVLDETEYFGAVHYSNRELNIPFYIPYGKDYQAVYTNFMNRIHGQKFQIWLSNDTEWFYEGRVSVGDLELSDVDGWWGFDVTCDCEPYRYYLFEKTVSASTTAMSVTITVGRKYICPYFSWDNSSISYITVTDPNENSYTIYKDVGYDPSLIVGAPNDTTIKITSPQGSTNVTITYKRGKF